MTQTLRLEHLRELVEGHAIAPEIAFHAVISSEIDPAMIFTWWDGVTRIGQLRLDPDARTEGRPKYEWPKGQPLILNRWREPDAGAPVLLIEGTCQHLAVASWTTGVGVYGMVGCWGWAKTDLSWAKGRDVITLFDADLTTNRRVWEAGKALAEQLTVEGATAVKFIRPPGRAKEGIDDVLARRAPATRTEFLARLIEGATTKLGRAPAAKTEVKIDAVAAEIMRAQPVALTPENRVALYQGGVYRRDAAAFNATAVAVLGENYWPAFVAATEQFCAGLLYAEGRRLPDRMPGPLLNVANGMLDLITGELKPHDPIYLSSAQLPVPWLPDAVAPVYEAWLAAQAGDQAEDLEEVTSTMLDPSRTPSKAAFLFGPARSGKSTFLRLAEAVAGQENRAAVTLRELSDDRFAAADIYGKIVNSAADISAGHVEDISAFKLMTGEDPIRAQRKFGHAFTFTNQALFMFSANELPTVGESSRAYSQRIKPFRFGRSFAGAENPGIEEEMMTELAGILVRWVRAWRRLRARGTYLPTDPAVAAEFEARSDRVRQWVRQCCRIITQTPDGSPVGPGTYLPNDQVVAARDLARQFVTWAAETGAQAMGERKIIDRLVNIEGICAVRKAEGASRGARGLNLSVLPRNQWVDEADSFEDHEPLTCNESDSGASILGSELGRGNRGNMIIPVANVGLIEGQDQEKESELILDKGVPPQPPRLDDNALTSTNVEGGRGKPADGTIVCVDRSGSSDVSSVSGVRAALINTFRTHGALTVDVEHSGYPVGHADHELRTVQIGGPDVAWVFDLRTPDPDARALIVDLLATVPRWHAHSAQADLVPLAHAGLCDETAWLRMFDTVIPAKLADPQSTGADPDLKRLAVNVLGPAAVSPRADAARAELFKVNKWRTKVDATTPRERSGWAMVDPRDPVMLTYAASDVLDTAELARVLPQVPPEILARERAVQRATARVTHRGLRIDGAQVERLRAEHIPARLNAGELIKSFGIENPGSDRQVADALTTHGIELPRTKPSKTHPNGQPSVAAAVLEQLRGQVAGPAATLIGAVIDFRHHDTVLGTFLEPYRVLVERGDGRARPTVYTLGTDTGRMSCVRPNLQQLPRVGGVRACITADPGYMLVSADFSGVELRVAAALSEDSELSQMIADGEDVHWRIARAVWGASATKADRYVAKRIVFGRLYGGGVPTLAAQAGISQSIAASVVDVLDMMTPGVAAWSEQLRTRVRAGAVQMPTYAGRIIHLTRAYPHKAPNYAIQGTARELLVDAIERWETTPWAGSVIMPVHDEVIVMVPEGDAQVATAELVRCMTSELYGVAIVAEPSTPALAWQDAT